jgi:translocation and assembly module TamB
MNGVTDRDAKPPRQSQQPARTRRLARGALWVLLAGLALTAVLWGFLLTPLGLSAAARLTEGAIKAASGMQARIEDVSGVFPFSLQVGRFALADANGPWLVISDARCSWAPAALFRGRVLVREIAADVIRLRRAPQMPASTTATKDEPVRLEWPPRFPTLPPILVDRLAVSRLILDKELAGQAAVIGLSGRLAESGQGAVALRLDATRLDGDKPLSFRLGGALNYADWRLAAKATLNDASGGLLASALAGPDGGPLVVAFTGDGSLAAWKGRLGASLAQKEFLAADVGLAVPLEKTAIAAFSLTAAGTLPPDLLPEAAARLVGMRPTCDAAGRLGIVSGSFSLDKLVLQTAAGSLTAEAAFDPDKDTLAATARLNVPDASRLDPALAGELAATATAAGTIARPRLDVVLSAKALRAGPLTLHAADVAARAEPAGSLDGAFPGGKITLSGTLAGLAGPGGTTLLGDALTLALAADIDAAGGVAVSKATLAGKGGGLTLTDGRVKNGRTGGQCSLDMADVAGAASLAGLRLTGALAAVADVALDETGTGQAAVTAHLTGLAGKDPGDATGSALAALLGPAPRVAAKAEFSPSGARLSELALDGKAVGLSGSGAYAAKDDGLTAKVTAKIPDMAVLGPALGSKCGGALDVSVDLSGTAEAPRLTVKGAADRLVFDDLALTRVELEGAASDVAAKPAGQLRLTARREGETARLETAFALTGKQLAIRDMRLAAPEAAFSGEAVLDTTTGRVTGKLSGNAASLAGLGRFTGLPLAGSLKLTATAGVSRASQSLACDLTAAGLRGFGLAAASLAVSANLDDLSGQPRGKGTLAAKGLAVAGCALDAVGLNVDGDGRTMALSVETKGSLPGARLLDLAAKASLAPSGRGRRLTVAALSGSLDKRKFALTAPAILTFGDGNTRLDGLVLSYDKARLTASANIGTHEAAAKATVDHFPLPLLAAFGLSGVDGTGTVVATLAGSPAKPTLTTDIRLDGLKLASEKGQGLPSLGLRAMVTVAGGKCTLTGNLAGSGKNEAVAINATLPLRFALDPFVLDVPVNSALSGRLTADSDLSDLATLLAQANTRLVGRLTADLALGGSLAAPSATGSLALAASRLENADAGLVLRNVAVRLDAAGGVLTVAKAVGEDVKGGSFAMTGKVGINDPTNGPVDLSLRLTHLRVAGLDLATVTADGALAVTGTLSRMRAAGQITLGPADINLPHSLPPDVVVIPVTLVNNPNAPKTSRAVTPPAAARHIDLDVKVTLGQAVYVRGMGLESRWAGQLAVTGTAAAPIVVGKYYVDKGRIDLFGSNLDITRGDVVFRGGTPPAPSFDIRAERTANDVTAGVTISGDASSPTIALTSTPTLPHDEILSRILFGQSASTLSPVQAAQLAQAAASLYAGGTPTSILARTRRILGLDQLTLVSGKGSMATTVLRAGKEIVKGVTVGVEQGMGAQSGAVSVEVQVTPNITVDSRVGTNNKQGVGVNWKWDY